MLNKYNCINWNYQDRILTLTLNRPNRLNAINDELHKELATLFIDAANDPLSDVIILTGANGSFSAGGDIDWLQGQIDDHTKFELTAREAKQIIFAMLDCEKPIISKIHDNAIGLGCTLALFCDVIYAAENAKIADPHVGIGLVAGDGGAIIWPQLIGYARAKEYLMTGKALTGTEAARIGLINHAVPASQLDEKVEEFSKNIANGPLKAIKWTKASVNIGLKQLAHSIMDTCIAYEMITNHTQDHQEGLDAFKERRRPNFKGM
ncbi:enoyl-CoA hydratase [Acinetobacter sp. TGL-Y2]|uniref:enoyl-CoA hydratase/isomerase family protein n=1 Tax=Acinetobacter sp. TGL-Y2 TaxID=1407071 RepID=UPI0007A6626B|nr:enoyl-CoA hydratase-related protein [Acinetobacter sp. TGL-Y2]AMW78427.1 enoyl-CoA hydratase [Acinetobacter sp. TGL-Y2]